MNLLIDTNRYTDFAQGDETAIRRFQSANRIFFPFIVLGELRSGFLGGTRTRENQATLTRMLMRPDATSLFADADTTHHYAALVLQLRKQGTPIPTNDIWIAALAVQHDLVLFSRDLHFKHIPQIATV